MMTEMQIVKIWRYCFEQMHLVFDISQIKCFVCLFCKVKCIIELDEIIKRHQ